MEKILVIDDDVDILDAVKITLEDAGYNVVTSDKGEYAESLSKGNNSLPDLLILDVLLSGKDGRIICKNLKKNPTTHKLPIIMISAHPNADVSTKAALADDFLSKPFTLDDLLEKVEFQLQRKS